MYLCMTDLSVSVCVWGGYVHVDATGSSFFTVVRNANFGFKALVSHWLAIWPQVHYLDSQYGVLA